MRVLFRLGAAWVNAAITAFLVISGAIAQFSQRKPSALFSGSGGSLLGAWLTVAAFGLTAIYAFRPTSRPVWIGAIAGNAIMTVLGIVIIALSLILGEGRGAAALTLNGVLIGAVGTLNLMFLVSRPPETVNE